MDKVGSFSRQNTGTNWADDVDEEEAELQRAGSTLQAPQPVAVQQDFAAAPPSPGGARVHSPGGPPRMYDSGPTVPEHPPFKAYLGNIPYEIDEGVVEQFFRGLQIVDIIITRHHDSGKPKGAFVEFASQQDLADALSLSGTDMLRRPVRIEVAEPPRGGMRGRDGGGGGGGYRRGPYMDEVQYGGRRGGGYDEAPYGGRRGGGGYEEPFTGRRGGREDYGDSFGRRGFGRGPPGGGFGGRYEDEPAAPLSPRERPKLLLKPRSGPTEAVAPAGEEQEQQQGAAPPAARSNPFGNARPTDTAAKLKELEERDRQRKAEEAAKRKAEREAAAAAGGSVTSPRAAASPRAANGGTPAAKPAAPAGTKPAVVTVPRPHPPAGRATATAPPPPPAGPKPASMPAEGSEDAGFEEVSDARARGAGRTRGEGRAGPPGLRGRGEGGRSSSAAGRGPRGEGTGDSGGRGGGRAERGGRAGSAGRGRGGGRSETSQRPADKPGPSGGAVSRLAAVVQDEKPVETKLVNQFDLLSVDDD